MLTSGRESREFLYADDCSEGLYIIMRKFLFLSKKKKRSYILQLVKELKSLI